MDREICDKIVQLYFSDENLNIDNLKENININGEKVKVVEGTKVLTHKKEINILVQKKEINSNDVHFNQESQEKENFVREFLAKKFEKVVSSGFIHENFIYVLEDPENFKFHAGFKLDLPHLKVALESLAKFHSISFLGKLPQETCGKFSFEAKLDDLLKEHPDLFSTIIKSKKVLCHGNLIPGNLLFSYLTLNKPKSCKIINFADLTYAPAIFDVLHLIYFSLEKSEIFNHLDDLLQTYENCLINELKSQNLSSKQIIEIQDDLNSTFKNCLNFVKILQDKKYEKTEIIPIEDIYITVKRKLNSTNFQVENSTLKNLSELSGFLGEHFILLVNLRQNENILRFFVKALPSTKTQRTFAVDTGAIFKEYSMFNKIIPAIKSQKIDLLDECLPKCYLTRLNEYLIFEDLSWQGYKTLNKRSYMDLESVKIVIVALAKIHASVLIFEENVKNSSSNSTYSILDDFPEEFKEAFFSQAECCVKLTEAAKKGLRSQIEFFYTQQEFSDLLEGHVEEIIKKAEESLDDIYEVVKPSTKYRNTLTHGDLWANNILFKFNEDNKPTSCKIVDWQSFRYTPPALDFWLFLQLSTNREFRKSHVEEIKILYFDELKKNVESFGFKMDEVLSFEEFLKSCDEVRPSAIANATILHQCILFTSEQMSSLFAEEKRNNDFFYEDRSEIVVEMCRNDPVYRNVLWESVLDFKDICV